MSNSSDKDKADRGNDTAPDAPYEVGNKKPPRAVQARFFWQSEGSPERKRQIFARGFNRRWPGDAGQRLLGDRAEDGPNAAFEMEMDRGRTDAQRLGELAQAEPVRAGALDQLGGGGDDRRFGQAGAGSGLPLFLSIWTRGLLFGYFDDGHDDARDEQGKGVPQANQ